MKKNILISSISVITASLLIGCGGGSSTTTEAEDTTLSARFVDSPVENLEYECDGSGLSGKTDKNGTFKYEKGDKVKFHIGNLHLGEATPIEGKDVTPKDLTEDNETLKLMLQLLQSLDSDNNRSNGITIPTDVIESLSQLDTTVVVDDLNKSEILELDDELAEKIDKDGDHELDVKEEEALNHFNSTIDKIKHNEEKNKEKAQEQGKNKEKDNSSNDNANENGKDNGNKNGNGNKHGNNQEGSKEGAANSEQNSSSAVIDLSTYETYILPQEVKDAIAYMGNEERLAYDVYKTLYETHAENGEEIKQLLNIADKSEIRHIQTVRDIVTKYNIEATELTKLDNAPVGDPLTAVDSIRGKYDIQKIQDLYNFLFDKGVTSAKDALEVGCMVEVTDINDLNEYITVAENANVQDVVDAFTALRKGSYNHYWAFDKGLKNMGVEDGCCSLGEINGVNYCQPDYPQKENEQEGEDCNKTESENNETQEHGLGYGKGNHENNATGENNNTERGPGYGKANHENNATGENNNTERGPGYGKANHENNATGENNNTERGPGYGKANHENNATGENNATEHGPGYGKGKNKN